MRQTINGLTSLIFIYSLIVCATCKQVSPDTVGNLELDALSFKSAKTVPLMKTKQTPATTNLSFSASAYLPKEFSK